MAAMTDGMKDLPRFGISDGRTEQLLLVDNMLSMWQMNCIGVIWHHVVKWWAAKRGLPRPGKQE